MQQASVKTISEIQIDPKVLLARMEHQEKLNQLAIERLPGAVKTKWVLGHKMEMDQAIVDALNVKEEVKEKVKTKGRFVISTKTNGGNWMMDREWVYLANPALKKAEDSREEFEINILKKRLQQKIIQNMALE